MSQPESHDVDISLILTVHSESAVAGPTIRSAESAIDVARSKGLVVETLLGMDAPTEDCVEFCEQSRLSAWKKHRFTFCDQGRARNALAKLATGRWIAFLDGDDLISENWLSAASLLLREAQDGNGKIIVHPEINWGFDMDNFILAKTAQTDPLFTPYYFAVANYYDALCMAPRNAFIEIPYATRDVEAGFAYEDWQWNIETMDLGWRHVVAPDTIIFKRRREGSQTLESSERRACIRQIVPMAVDQIKNLGSD